MHNLYLSSPGTPLQQSRAWTSGAACFLPSAQYGLRESGGGCIKICSRKDWWGCVMNDSWYDTAQICLNGHSITSSFDSSPEQAQKFCDKCGAHTITACQSCNVDIRGYYHVPGFVGLSEYSPLSFCHNCGEPYPWTRAKLKAAKELADELDNLTAEEIDILKKSLDDIVQDTPQATIGVTRFKTLVAKAGKGAAEGFRNILVNVLSEAMKKQIWQ